MKLVNSGPLLNGGSWRAFLSYEAGRASTFLVGHWPFPAAIMEKCLLDERFQISYDSYIAKKDVISFADEPKDPRDQSSHHRQYQQERCEILHHEFKMPSPLKNRDYVYYRRRRRFVEAGGAGGAGEQGVAAAMVAVEEKAAVEEAATTVETADEEESAWGFCYKERDVVPSEASLSLAPKDKKCIRAGRGFYWRLGLCRPDAADPKGCMFLVRSQEDFAGNIPSAIVNFAAKHGCVRYVETLQTAALSLMVDGGRLTAAEAKTWGKAAKGGAKRKKEKEKMMRS